MSFHAKSPGTSVVALKSDTVAEKSTDELSRDFSGRSIFDFCNNICHNRTHAPQRIGMLSSSSVGSFREFGLVTNRLPARTIRRLPTLQCQGAHRYRSGFIAWPFSPMRRRLIN